MTTTEFILGNLIVFAFIFGMVMEHLGDFI